MTPTDELHAALRRYWGYDSFRPLQERIVRSLVADHDVAVVMPTGGGKSLCYQLPALVSGKTAIVISPLIALMQDQAAQLEQMGIPAAVLNSAISPEQQSATMRFAQAGAFRLLYLSPERLVRADTIRWLSTLPLAFFAIDEAHCISEWGHEFRPEYRQLRSLRKHFPGVPIAAFTASATRQVRHDILEQLQLEEPHKFIASFHRPNLRYISKMCDSRSQGPMLLRAMQTHRGSNVIVYAPTIAKVEDTVDFLGDHGFTAVPYHGQMETSERQVNQERWMSDEVPILVGTLAFGLGINKPGVRAVIHLSLPKSIEQYYQEAGRAGRDGLPADCVLLWQKKDAGLLAYFIEKNTNAEERDRAWERYHAVKDFASNALCRHRQVCVHFGETPKWNNCGACDVCAPLPEWFNDKVVVEARPKKKSGADDPGLLEYLKEWRREVARRNNVPAFFIVTDATLLDICAKLPRTLQDLQLVSGIGARKSELYGEMILDAMRRFQLGERAVTSDQKEAAANAGEETLELLRQGRTIAQIAQLRSRQLGTVVSTVASLIEQGKVTFDASWVRAELMSPLEAAASELGLRWLKPIKERVPDATFDEVRLVIAKLRARQ